MIRSNWTPLNAALVLGMSLITGCASTSNCNPFQPSGEICNTEGEDSCQENCESRQEDCESCEQGGDSCDKCRGGWRGWWAGKFRSHAIPEVLPLGVIPRAHYQAMETNAEAVDFILFRLDFVLATAELTPDGKDKLLEIAARMRSAPFPVLIERSENNSDPELDSYRRNLIAQILTDLGNPDADQRTIVAPAYGPGYNSIEAQRVWVQHIGGGGQNNNNNNNGGGGGGFGGGFGGGGGGF